MLVRIGSYLSVEDVINLHIADQIRGSYRVDHWMRNFKWWHSIYWWGVQVLMVNSYKCYCTHLKLEGLTPMSHYDYQRKIAHVWLDKNYYAKCDNEPSPTSTSKSVVTSTSSLTSTNSNRRFRICDSSLHPLTGSLKCRLNSTLEHWPSPPPKASMNCQLHYWLTSQRKYKDVQYCKTCNVSLCTEYCYECFHTEWDILSQKSELKEKCEANLDSTKEWWMMIFRPEQVQFWK